MPAGLAFGLLKSRYAAGVLAQLKQASSIGDAARPGYLFGTFN
jgi:hypothetical protein